MSIAMVAKEKRRFSLQEAKELVPLVRRVTAYAVGEVKTLLSRLELLDEGDPEFEEAYGAIDLAVQLWAEKLQKMGCGVKGLWLVDFDNGQGYYCWRYPEEELDHFRGYEDDFEERTRIC